MHNCPCCGYYVYSDDPKEICSDCINADCEPNKEGEYDSCNCDLMNDPFEDIEQ